MRLLLIRHGQTEWNNDSRAQGHTDVALDETGMRQSALLGAAFETGDIDLVLSSDLRRSRQTAEPIAAAAGVPLELDSRLRERTFGDWEGHLYSQVADSLQKIREASGSTLFDAKALEGRVNALAFTEDGLIAAGRSGIGALVV